MLLLTLTNTYRSLLVALSPPGQDLVVDKWARDMIAHYEGLGKVIEVNGVKHCLPYICSGGKPTLGRGRVISWDDYYRYKKSGGIPISLADKWFEEDLNRFAKGVSKLVKVPLTPWQAGAIISLSYNIGLANFKGSTLLKKLNLRDFTGAANEFPKWVYANKKKLQGLVNRREAERRMFINNPPRPEPGKKVANLLEQKKYMRTLLAE